ISTIWRCAPAPTRATRDSPPSASGSSSSPAFPSARREPPIWSGLPISTANRNRAACNLCGAKSRRSFASAGRRRTALDIPPFHLDAQGVDQLVHLRLLRVELL